MFEPRQRNVSFLKENIMGQQYLGHLPKNDPLHGYLQYDIQPQVTGFRDTVKYRVFRLNGSNAVYLYEERYSGARFIGKFFLPPQNSDPDAASRRLYREYHNLRMMRNLGFTGYPHYIARPLGCNASLNHLLVVEYCDGELLSSLISRSIRNHDDGLLFYKLTALAYFLATFHNRTAREVPVDFNGAGHYMDSLVGQLFDTRTIDWNEMCEFHWLRDRWKEQPKMWSDRQVLVHGDATPENFLFGNELSVMSFDLERVQWADRVYDTGRIAAELQHFFLLETGNKYLAEPFIGHFLWEYSCHFPDREQTFRSVTGRVPFYMGTTLLRIARNPWLTIGYRRGLIQEAKQCLRRYS